MPAASCTNAMAKTYKKRSSKHKVKKTERIAATMLDRGEQRFPGVRDAIEEIEVFGETFAARRAAGPLFDPKMEKMKC